MFGAFHGDLYYLIYAPTYRLMQCTCTYMHEITTDHNYQGLVYLNGYMYLNVHYIYRHVICKYIHVDSIF